MYQINLTSGHPNNNAYHILAFTKKVIEKLGLDLDFETVKSHLTEGDYDQLVDTFISYFQDIEEIDIIY